MTNNKTLRHFVDTDPSQVLMYAIKLLLPLVCRNLFRERSCKIKGFFKLHRTRLFVQFVNILLRIDSDT